jgi:GH35 family endo-1,4-beta-xylanase
MRWAPIAALFLMAGASAQTPVLPADPLAAFRLSCASGGRAERVAVEGQPFAEALRLTTPANISTGSDREWSCRIRHALAVPVQQNDWLVAVYWIRSIESTGEAYIKLNVERNAPDYRKSVSSGTLVTSNWRRIQVPFRMVESYQPGGAIIDFWIGYDPQVIELGGISIENHGPSASAPLPARGYTYPGAEADAPWRAAAAERIERIRKSGLSLRVIDANGAAVAGAAVKVRMKRHAFGWGSAVAASAILGVNQDAATYRETAKRLFNQVVVENDLKWPQWEQDRNRAMRLLDWLHDNGLGAVRGHNMVWPGWQYLPADLRALSPDPEALRRRIDNHILAIGSATRGRVIDWDVVNEPIPNRDLQNILGDYELVRWFQLARAADPEARLYINEYDIETGGGRNRRKQDQYFDLIRDLLDRGAPVGGIGIQGHFGSDLTDPVKVFEILDRFARFQLPIKITEFDINISDEELQADYTRDYLTICFSHPAIESVLIWGFWEGRHWLPSAALYRRDWSEKPNGKVWRELLFEKWWTNAEVVTNAEGKAEVNGFLGDYEIEVTASGRTVTRAIKLVKEMEPVEIRLD